MTTERIVAAAIQYDGVTISLPRPARHGQVINSAVMFLSDVQRAAATQGFLTSRGRFVNRVQAMQIAHIARQKQLRPENERSHRELFSEDLW